MKTSSRPLILIALVLALATLAGANTGEVPVQPVETNIEGSELQAESAERHRPRTPLMTALQATFDKARAQLATLEECAAKCADEMEFLEIQREIEQLHADTELSLLQVQLTHYRDSGNLEAVQKIETMLAKMAEPRPTPKLVERPAPSAQSQR